MLSDPELSIMPKSNNFKMMIKLLAFGFFSPAISDLLKSRFQISGRTAEFVGILLCLLLQQLFPPRLGVSKFLLILGGVIVVGTLSLLNK